MWASRQAPSSNFFGAGCGLRVDEWGINLHNRGAYFSLDPAHVNVIAPGKRTLHTLMPAFARRDGRPWLVFGTMGADGQLQTQVQLLARLVDDGADPAAALSAPRWFVDPGDFSVQIENRFPPALVEPVTEGPAPRTADRVTGRAQENQGGRDQGHAETERE